LVSSQTKNDLPGILELSVSDVVWWLVFDFRLQVFVHVIGVELRFIEIRNQRHHYDTRPLAGMFWFSMELGRIAGSPVLLGFGNLCHSMLTLDVASDVAFGR
ncbi:unnamed protein product, partial [Sphacelaria rigidula]